MSKFFYYVEIMSQYFTDKNLFISLFIKGTGKNKRVQKFKMRLFD